MTANAKPVESAPQTNASEVARIEQAMDIPAPAASSHDITVRIADAGEHGADIRFVEHAGEVRVSVKTADPEMAQALRGGLNDFANRMEQSGIRTEVWRPGADANSSQNPQDQFDQKGRQQNRERDSQQGSQQENPNSSKPGWVEELETSLARSNVICRSIQPPVIRSLRPRMRPTRPKPRPTRPMRPSTARTALGNENTFLQLLVAQIQNQDPTQPMDSTTFLTQLHRSASSNN